MATARKLKSGSWRCRIFDYTDGEGKRHYRSFTAPTKKEAERMAAQWAATEKGSTEEKEDRGKTVMEVVEKYLLQKKEVLSPSTYRMYRCTLRTSLTGISGKKISQLNSGTVQAWIGALSVNHKPKTVKNAYGLLSAAIGLYYPDIHFNVKLPQKEAVEYYVPTDDDVETVVDYFREHDRDMFVACSLAAFGTMRRSEICALVADDVDGTLIRINKAMVLDDENNWVIKTTKNLSSTRFVEINEETAAVLPKNGRLVNLHPQQVTNRFSDALDRLDIPDFTFHALRHYSASVMHAIGVPDEYIMQRGGWSSDYTLKNIYRGTMNDFQKHFTDITNAHFEKMHHEMHHKEKKA